MRAPDVLLKKLKDAKVKPVDLAKALDVTDAMASMMLAGKRGISVWHLDRVAALLEVSVPELFISSDLTRHERDQRSDFPKGISDGSAAADSARLQQQYEELLTAATDVAYTLNKALVERGIAVPLPEHDAGNSARRSRVRKRARKAG